MKKNGFFFQILLPFLLFCFAPNSVWAQESDMLLGLGIAVSATPEEQSLAKGGQTSEFFFDLGEFRVGYNQTAAQSDLALFDRYWNIYLKTETLFMAWKAPLGEKAGQGPYALLGGGYFITSLDLGNGVPTQSTQDFGFLLGLGTSIDLNGLLLGAQWSYFSSKSVYTDIPLATGANQILLTIAVGL